ncbi:MULTISPECIES: heavy-metal-associated domain-containing protein [Stenotrophomonas]|jgi:copper chaperone|uniref:Copper chaperone n=1 Tax=Stenotrophomonas maltophilia TaxID=40324 RepID=A0A4S2CYQ6_STEMA|nr:MULTISPECIES: heavy-metal-associated domain-containing protein [Stenotrophomonas]MBD3826626.1 heavy-metal-associated domain-containing protein [Stenotrophomonas sp.]QIO88360.1 hypothetical protein G9274_002045 [Stenotrophomonas rhizophila]TGY34217.1 copper chaperone [Stenotrophomonas maltophilia]HBS62522.1 copper chaperone [Stenotrophomonas sp.]
MFQFHIPNMTCGGCAHSVTRALLDADPRARIETDPSARSVEVQSERDESVLLAALLAAGYPHTARPDAARS